MHKNELKNRERQGVRSSLIGIISNTAIFLIKLLVGIFANSVAILADSFNNLADSITSFAALIGFRLANKPADKEHPFGHGRSEDISGLIIAFIIFLFGYEFARSSIIEIFEPSSVYFDWFMLVMLFVAFFIKLWLFFYYRKAGKKLNSEAFMAIASDSINDCIITLATLGSIMLAYFFGIVVDGFAGLILSLLLLRTAYKTGKVALSNLLGKGADKELKSKLEGIVLGFDGILGVHDLVIHNYGHGRNVATIHAELPMNISIEDSHNLIDAAEKAVLEKLNIGLVIHIDPVDTNNERTNAIRASIDEYISKNNLKAFAHDFSFCRCQKGDCLDFELSVAYEYSDKQVAELVNSLRAFICTVEPNYLVNIKLERGEL